MKAKDPIAATQAVASGRPCPQCGHVSAEVRCPRCNALTLTSCSGACALCKTKRACGSR